MSFDDFVTARLPTFLRYATVLTCDPHLAEDLVQEVLLRAQRKWRRIEALDVPEAYVRRMITNEYLSWRRRRSSRDLPLPPDAMAQVAPLTDPVRAYDERQAMVARIAALPRQQRTVLALRYYCGLSDTEVAQAMGCRPSTVRGYMSRALAVLRTDSTNQAVTNH